MLCILYDLLYHALGYEETWPVQFQEAAENRRQAEGQFENVENNSDTNQLDGLTLASHVVGFDRERVLRH